MLLSIAAILMVGSGVTTTDFLLITSPAMFNMIYIKVHFIILLYLLHMLPLQQ